MVSHLQTLVLTLSNLRERIADKPHEPLCADESNFSCPSSSDQNQIQPEQQRHRSEYKLVAGHEASAI